MMLVLLEEKGPESVLLPGGLDIPEVKYDYLYLDLGFYVAPVEVRTR